MSVDFDFIGHGLVRNIEIFRSDDPESTRIAAPPILARSARSNARAGLAFLALLEEKAMARSAGRGCRNFPARISIPVKLTQGMALGAGKFPHLRGSPRLR